MPLDFWAGKLNPNYRKVLLLIINAAENTLKIVHIQIQRFLKMFKGCKKVGGYWSCYAIMIIKSSLSFYNKLEASFLA